MSKYLKKVQKNNDAVTSKKSAALERARRSVCWQAGLALVTVMLTIVIVFTMTSAWYTNVVQTGGMTIQAESWGFEGQIKVDESVIVAAPGDEGIINLEVNNSNASTTAIGVGVSKARIADYEMQKRLYFYVDTSMQRNGEIMDRVYLNTQEGYAYTLFAGETLTLTEEVHNDAQLKWQWVYDVLGYYVLGSWSSATGNVTELEYLRPIEYDYNEATTTFQDDKSLIRELETIDGELTVEEFLVEFSKKDGYEGTIDPDKKQGTGYYPVLVDENGYGVYAYLCSYTEIELATQYDTNLAQKSLNAAEEGIEPEKYEVRLLISAQKNDENVINVNSLDALNKAMELETGNVVQLTGDLTITDAQRLVIPEGKQITVDLNGHTITSTVSDSAIHAEPNSTLTMLNGTVVGPGNVGYGLYSTGAKVTFNQVDISEFKYGVYIGDSDDNNTQDSAVRLIDCEISGSVCAVFASGNGTASDQKTQLVIDGCELYSENIVLSGNGNVAGNGRWGTDIQIIDSVLTGDPNARSAGIYHPQMDSKLTIYNSTVSAYTAIAIKGGSVSIKASTVTGNGEAFTGTLNPSGSGFVDTGDGIYIEANYEYPVTLEISSDEELNKQSVISSNNNQSLRVYPEDASHVQVVLYGGVFNQEQPVVYLAPGTVQTGSDGVYIITSQEAAE